MRSSNIINLDIRRTIVVHVFNETSNHSLRMIQSFFSFIPEWKFISLNDIYSSKHKTTGRLASGKEKTEKKIHAFPIVAQVEELYSRPVSVSALRDIY